MSEIVPNPNQPLGKQARELEQARNYELAVELYKQAYTNQPNDGYAASGYMRCLRKLNKSVEAAQFGRSLTEELRANEYVHSAWAWALYDCYFKQSESKEEDESIDETLERSEGDLFQRMQNVTNYVLKKTPPANVLLRTKFVFGICREAKLRGKWQIVYDFAMQLDVEKLERQPTEGRRMSEYEQWLYLVIKALFEIGRYGECLTIALQGVESYPQNKHFPWWKSLSKAKTNQAEEALIELQDLDKRYQEWFIREDIAKICEQLQRDDEAWIWYCKAAALQGPLKARYKMIGQMAALLQRLGRWQEAYEHLQLASLLAEREQWGSMQADFKRQMLQLQQQHSQQIQSQEYTPQNFSQLQRKLQSSWNSVIAVTLPHGCGHIRMINEERKFGFIKSDKGEFHFSFHSLPRNLQPVIDMKVEFDVEESFDHKKQRNSFRAINIRPVKKCAEDMV